MENVIKVTLEIVDNIKEDISEAVSVFTNEGNNDDVEGGTSTQNINLDRFNQRICYLGERVSARLDDLKARSSKVAAATAVASGTFFDALRVANETEQCEFRCPAQKASDAKEPKPEPDSILDTAKEKATDFGFYSMAIFDYATCKSKKVLNAAMVAKVKFEDELHKDDEEDNIVELCPELMQKPTKTVREPEANEESLDVASQKTEEKV